MQKYQRFLRVLFILNTAFVVWVAGLGFQKEKNLKSVFEISNVGNTQSRSSVESKISNEKKVIPVGKTVGIYVNTKGILVIDTGEVLNQNGIRVEPAKNKLMAGDYIYSLNGSEIRTKKELISKITKCDGKVLCFGVNRNNEKIEVSIQPVETGIDEYKVGIWVRDDLQGLGTITYLDGKHYGALGHSINDADTGKMLSVCGGKLYEADIFGLKKGESGKPGVIEGIIAYDRDNIVGDIEKNCVYGIYGNIDESYCQEISNCDAMPIADARDVELGKAYIQSYVDGKLEKYEIEITNRRENENGDLEMQIHVVDKKLLQLTGGIIQGMFTR